MYLVFVTVTADPSEPRVSVIGRGCGWTRRHVAVRSSPFSSFCDPVGHSERIRSFPTCLLSCTVFCVTFSFGATFCFPVTSVCNRSTRSRLPLTLSFPKIKVDFHCCYCYCFCTVSSYSSTLQDSGSLCDARYCAHWPPRVTPEVLGTWRDPLRVLHSTSVPALPFCPPFPLLHHHLRPFSALPLLVPAPSRS